MAMGLGSIQPILKRRQEPGNSSIKKELMAVSTSTPSFSRSRKLLHVGLFLYGLAAMIMAIYAQVNAQRLPPVMLDAKFPCAIVEIDCIVYGFRGTDEELTTILKSMDAMTLSALTFANCRALQVPVMLRQPPMLTWLAIFNSTLVEWPLDAALTQQDDHRISRVFLIQTNMAEWPHGLLSQHFPTTVSEIGFIATNLTVEAIPKNLHDYWKKPMLVLAFERGQWTQIPSVLLQNVAKTLSLVDNRIENVSDSAFAPDAALQNLSLALNPLQSLQI